MTPTERDAVGVAQKVPHSRRGPLVGAFYGAIDEAQEDPSIRPLIDWRDYNGYTVVAKSEGIY